jgi:hypothetical protein
MKRQKELYTFKFKTKVKVSTITEDGIVFSDGTKITHEHGQDCCEQVYAEWLALVDQNITMDKFTKLKISGHPGLGIILNGYAVPCYNKQNGHYSDKLYILITTPQVKHEIDISEYTEFEYN